MRHGHLSVFFGSRLIRMSLETGMKGAVEMSYAPEGLTARLRFRS